MATATKSPAGSLESLLGDDAASLLEHTCTTVTKEHLHLPGPDFVDRVWARATDRPACCAASRRSTPTGASAEPATSRSCPSTRASSTPRARRSRPTPRTSTARSSSSWPSKADATRSRRRSACSDRSRRWAHKIPFIVKINHNELLTYPNRFDQVLFGTVEQASDLGAVAVGATIYFGSAEATRQLQEIAVAFARAHELGMATVLWCYLRNDGFKKDGVDYSAAADLTGQANHLGVTIQADIIKQKLPTNNGGYTAINFGKTSPLVYDALSSDHPIDLCRYQVVNCYMGRSGLINSGGESKGASDLAEAVRTAVINKRAGGTGLISGRKAFQRPMAEGIQLLNAIQDVYLNESVTVA